MRYLRFLFILTLSFILHSCGSDPEEITGGGRIAPDQTGAASASYLEDEVIVRLGSATIRPAAVWELLPGAREIDRFTVASGATVRTAGTTGDTPAEEDSGSFTLARLRLPPGLSVPEAIERLRQNPSVEHAEPNYRVRRAAVPNDPFFSKQWGLANTGQTLTGDKGTIIGKAGSDIGARDAWDLATGDGTVVVAVVDSGIDTGHPDLAANIWLNPGETGTDDLGREIATNGLDDDGNGYVDDVRGWNFVANSANSGDDDVDGHGTHVAGIIGAGGGNSIGIGGLNWRVQLMPVKFLDRSGNGTLFDAIKAMRYAIAEGARVVNASYTYPQSCIQMSPSTEEKNAIADAAAAGILVVTAAGNFGCNNDMTPFYPASHPLDNILAVAATDPLDSKVSWSNYGPTRVDLGAPGLNIYSTVRTALFGIDGQQGYDYLSGTSMAAPFVAGAAALLWSKYPDLGYAEIRDLLLATVDPLPSLAGKTVSGGRLNLARALQADLSLIAPGAPAELEAVGAGGGAVELSWRDLSDNETEFIVERGATGEPFSQVARVGANENFYTDLNAPDGTSQSYRVKALAGIRTSEPSNEATVIVPLKAPGDLTAIAIPGAGINLVWTAVSARAESYAVERRLLETDFAIVATVPAGTTKYLDGTTVHGQSYVYRVRAYNAVAGYSADSPEVAATFPASSKSSSGGSGCFIATAAWGSAFAPEVAALREYRDRVLLHHSLGRRFVEAYYRFSPPVAAVIADSPLLKQIVRFFLWPVAQLASLATPAEAMERRPPAPADPSVIEGELLVRFHKDVPEERIAAVIEQEGCEILDRTAAGDGGLYRLRLPVGLSVEEAQTDFSRYPEVASSEPNRRVQIRPVR